MPLIKETISESVFSGLETPSEQLLDPSLPYCDVGDNDLQL